MQGLRTHWHLPEVRPGGRRSSVGAAGGNWGGGLGLVCVLTMVVV